MTKEQYLEMCDQLGTDPKEEEIPTEYEDFPLEVQEAFGIYSMLPARIAEFSGTYLGKDLGQLGFYFMVYKIPEEHYLFWLRLISLIDNIEVKITSNKAKANKASPKKGKA